MLRNLIFTIFCLLALGCQKEKIDPWKDFTTFIATYNTFQLAKSDQFESDGSKGYIYNINELSGLAESKMNTNSLWGHNDSDNPTDLFLLDERTGAVKATYHLNGVVNEDWEDIAVGPGPQAGVSYVYLGDIGDNKAERTMRTIYRFPEPLYAEGHAGKTIDFTPVIERIDFAYPDGPHNAETLLLDPVTFDLYVVTKYGTNSLLFVARYPQTLTSINTMKLVGTFPFREATGGDISADGNHILIKTYDQIFYWKRSSDQPVWKTLSTDPTLALYDPIELQGEAIAWNNQTMGYYTGSEKKNSITPQLYFYKMK